ncbi:hypothetical protein OQA88_13428 [Cercophora sp. LCS_1]
MQLINLLIALLAASAAEAYQVRIGYKRSNTSLGTDTWCTLFFKIWDDNWSYVAEKEYGGGLCFYDKFCTAHPCPFQVDGLEIGLRAVENGGSDGAVRVEAWKGSKSTWTWFVHFFKEGFYSVPIPSSSAVQEIENAKTEISVLYKSTVFASGIMAEDSMVSNAFLLSLCLGTTSLAHLLPRQTSGGSGPYPAAYSTDSGLSGQTIYMPANVPADAKLPVIVWGVGGCSDSGTNTAEFHQDLASYGFLVIVNNGPTARTQTQATSLTTAANWAEKAAGTGKYANVDKSRIAVGGWSCGGLQAYTVSSDPRWATIGIFSSGQLDASQSVPVASKITKPIFYFLGGNGDPAQAPGTRDYGNLPKTTPAWVGTNNKGHGHSGPTGTFTAPAIKTGAVRWAQWLLRGNTTAATFFTNNAEATAAGWTGISSQGLDKISVTPI